jgi:hypothetical protein
MCGSFFKREKLPSNSGSQPVYRDTLGQCFPNFSGARTTWNVLVLLEAQNADFYRDWWIT